MARYSYTALDSEGVLQSGEIDSISKSAAINALVDAGHTPISAHEVDPSKPQTGFDLAAIFKRSVSLKSLAVATRELSTMLNAGVVLERALELLVEVSEGRRIQKTLMDVLERVRGGATLSEAMRAAPDVFPGFYISVVEAGELGGSLNTVLASLSHYMDKSLAVRERIKSALTYPAILLVMIGLTLLLILTYVLPQFESIFDDAGGALPLPTRFVMGVGDLFASYWPLMVIGLVVLAWGGRRAFAVPSVRLFWDGLKLDSALTFGLVRKTETGRFCRTMGTLLGNGVLLTDALVVAKETVRNTVMANAVEYIHMTVKEGGRLGQTMFDTAVFPKIAVQLLVVGEETGRLDHMFIEVAEMFDLEVEQTTERLLSLLVPALTIGMGALVAGVIGSILVGIMSVNDLAL